METKRPFATALVLCVVLACFSLAAAAQQKMPPPRQSVTPLAPVGPDCTTIAGNLIVNCGFETGDFTGWGVVNPADTTTLVNGNANHGSSAAGFGSAYATNCIAQILATNPGQNYTLSFALNNSGRPNNFYVLFGPTATNLATVSGDMQNVPNFAYTQYTMGGLIGSGRDQVFFCARNSPSFFQLDDVVFN